MKTPIQEDSEFESLLREKLKPSTPPWESNREVLEEFFLKEDHELKRERRKHFLKHTWIGGLGMAAVLLLAFSFYFGNESVTEPETQGVTASVSPVQFGPKSQKIARTRPQPMEYEAIGSRNQLMEVKDKGWRRIDDDKVVREFKYEYLDTVDMINREDGSVIRVQVPREEIVNFSYHVI
ncbi:MAG: hypothetical protein MI748_01020 [Opitutales bacterium]|nr:hypothetical protein [Opitutales bacterium]